MDELLHQHQLVRVLLPKMLFTLVGGLHLTVFGAETIKGIG